MGGLYCVPVLLKDNFDTADMATSGGSIALKDSVPPDDAFMVKQLRDADAIYYRQDQYGGVGIQPACLHQLFLRNDRECLFTRARTGRLQWRHRIGNGCQFWRHRHGLRYRQFDSRTIVPPGTVWYSFDDRANQP